MRASPREDEMRLLSASVNTATGDFESRQC